MTSEVAIMNRQALALAADSATTVTRWIRGEKRRRFFKSTNKIFQVSIEQPIGLMIHGSADLLGVPWETLVKTFRDEYLKCKALASVDDYANEFFEWIDRNEKALPRNFLKEQLVSNAIGSLGRIIFPIIKKATEIEDEADKRTGIAEDFERASEQVNDASLLGNATEDDIKSALDEMRSDVEAAVVDNLALSIIANIIGKARLSEIGIIAVFKEDFTTLNESGLVFGGFGGDDYFPAVESYTCHGKALGKLIYSRNSDKSKKISQENTSELVPFAKSDMIWTFMAGVSIKGLVQIDELHKKSLDKVYEKCMEHDLLKESCAIDDIKKEVHKEFKDEVTKYFQETHMQNLRSVIGMLPRDELADLSETLVLIESLKERVTTDDESVSGPIDVAIISKNDGFVWIRRKHYFDGELNPRFFARMR